MKIIEKNEVSTGSTKKGNVKKVGVCPKILSATLEEMISLHKGDKQAVADESRRQWNADRMNEVRAKATTPTTKAGKVVPSTEVKADALVW